MKIRGKKGGGWLTFFVNHILSMLLIILSILFLGVLMKSALLSSAPTSDVADLRYNLLSARLLNSADCLAYEEPYFGVPVGNDVQIYKRVRAGVVDFNKLRNKESWSECVSNTPVAIGLRDLETGEVDSEENLNVVPDTPDVYFVKIYRNDLNPPEFHDGVITIFM